MTSILKLNLLTSSVKDGIVKFDKLFETNLAVHVAVEGAPDLLNEAFESLLWRVMQGELLMQVHF